jgi:hypothetical protein
VDLVDEQDHVVGFLGFFEDVLHAFLELGAILRAGDHKAHVEQEDPAVDELFGNVIGHDHLGDALDDGGLTDAGFADEDRVVFLSAGKHLDHPLDLVVAADDGVELVLGGELGDVARELVEEGRLDVLLALAPVLDLAVATVM